MAYVKYTAGIKHEVEQNLGHARITEINATLGKAPSCTITKDNAWIDTIEKHVWQEHLHLKPLLPSKWLGIVKEAAITIEEVHFKWVTAAGTNGIVLPPNVSTYNFHITLAREAAPPSTIVDNALAYYAAVKAVTIKYKELTSKLLGFLNQCKSVNEAVKMYPDIRLFLAKGTLERIDTKVERSSRSPETVAALSTLDREALTSIAVAHKLRT